MAVAISPEDGGFFGSSSPLRRCTSQPRFPIQQGGFRKSASASRLHDTYKPIFSLHPQQNDSPHSSPPSSSHTLSTDLSFASTPASNVSDSDETLSLERLEFHDSSSLHFPHYNLAVEPRANEDLEPPPSPATGDSCTVSSNEPESSTVTSTPESPDVVPKGFDDIAVQSTPSQHVDYLSHNWREEDIWASWKYVISNRSDYTNSERLENASWRTWVKSKNKLKTVSPEALNWLKDCDVTWLYGPLQQGHAKPSTTEGPTGGRLSKSASFISQKPILKKRSMSEVMLQQSLSAASLLKQATAAVQAQQNMALRRSILTRTRLDFPSFPISPMSRENSLAPSSDTSGLSSPNAERKRIHFNEQVEQCIAVDVKGEDDDGYESFAPMYDNDSDSDEGIIMKAVARKKEHPKPRKSALKKSNVIDTKTIASLPSTTLKYRDDSPEPQETAMKHTYKSPTMSPSSSQETLKPSKKSTKFYVDSDSDSDSDDEEELESDEEDGIPQREMDENDDVDEQIRTPRVHSPSPLANSLARPPSALSLKLGGDIECRESTGESTEESTGAGPPEDWPSGSGLRRSVSTNTLSSDSSGMRRTSSGMFMPIEEGEQPETLGIVGRVIDTVNTARDIAHVVWNAGWRR